MAFTIEFLYNNEPMNKITKSPQSLGLSLTGTLRDDSSIVDPVIMVECANPIVANYAYIDEFSRYYYIRNIEAYRSYQDENNVMHNLWIITMHTDVLKTFSEGILGSPCIVGKSSNRFNLYLNDNSYKVKQNDLISVQRFPDGFNLGDMTYVLTLLGNRTQTPPI